MNPPVIALYHTWPEIKNAEYEVVQRLIDAIQRCDYRVVVIDNAGVIIWFSKGQLLQKGRRLRTGQADLLISLHFESPKTVDIYSYYALWQPLEFYDVFGYERTTLSMASHNDLISCDSVIADAHGLNLFDSMKRVLGTPLPKVFHTLPPPFLEPKIDSRARLFYVGINWERLGKEKGRFHDVLINLADKGLVDIYGPELLLGVAPWAGFSSYLGELPFDGKAIKQAINQAGICLALSSEAHVTTGIMSNRLFEGFAGGGAVICNWNPFIEKYFSREVYLVDTTQGERALAMQIAQIVRQIRSDPADAIERVRRAQDIMQDKFRLDLNIRDLVEHHPSRYRHYQEKCLATGGITAIICVINFDEILIRECIAGLAAQIGVIIYLCIIREACGQEFVSDIKPEGSIKSIKICCLETSSVPGDFAGPNMPTERTGPLSSRILKNIGSDYFCFVDVADRFFSDHFGRLIKEMMLCDAKFGRSALVLKEDSLDGKVITSVGVEREPMSLLLQVSGQLLAPGRYLFERSLAEGIPKHLFQLLDGTEHLYFQAAGALTGTIAQTFYPSAEYDKSVGIFGLIRLDENKQRRYILDALSYRPEWNALVRSAESSFGNISSRSLDIAPRMQAFKTYTEIIPNLRYYTGEGQDGVPYLVAGFSYPEQDFTWCLEKGIIDFSLSSIANIEQFSFVFRISVTSRCDPQSGRAQHLTVGCNGFIIGYYPLNSGADDISIVLPLFKLPISNRFRLELTPDFAAVAVAPQFEIADPRLLSFYISSFVLEKRPFIQIPTLGIDKEFRMARSSVEAGHPYHQNFYPSEDDFAWIAGTEAKLTFELEDSLVIGLLRFCFVARSSLATGAPQSVEVLLNEVSLGKAILSDGISEQDFDFNQNLIAGGWIDIKFRLSHAEAVFDETHRVVDPRLIGLAVKSVCLGRTNASNGRADETVE